MINRKLSLSLANSESCFLWGPRQCGKSTLLKTLYPEAKIYDLLLSTEYKRLLDNPAAIREECRALNITGNNQQYPIIIDEVQKIPMLLDEVHWMIENLGVRFILCGSSARKLKRSHANLLGGRAVRYELHPFISRELPKFDLQKCLNYGLLPRHYLAKAPARLLQSYISDYLQEEIAGEALTRNIQAFSRFLEAAAICNGETVNYINISRECGVSAPAIKEYYQILVDTMIGSWLPAFSKRAKLRIVSASKFYLFDIGITAALTRRGTVEPRSELYGKAFEHFIYLEILAHSHYSEQFYPLSYWRTTSGFEVDVVLGNGNIAVEIKSTSKVNEKHFKGLRKFKQEFNPETLLLVCNEPYPRKTEDGILILPWKVFLEKLWSDEFQV